MFFLKKISPKGFGVFTLQLHPYKVRLSKEIKPDNPYSYLVDLVSLVRLALQLLYEESYRSYSVPELAFT